MEVTPDRPLTLEALVERPPLVHNDRTITWAIRPALAEILDRHVEPGMVTLETGAGLSTLVILRKGPRLHVAIQPNADEFAVIDEFAGQHGIDTRAFRRVVAKSQHYLPSADLPALDLVLIDGDHSFPAPFMDWYYTADRLKVGGLMIVDDIQIGTGTFLSSFMSVDPKWEEVVVHPQSFAVYRKRSDFINLGDWTAQPFLRDACPTEAIQLRPVGHRDLLEQTREELDRTRLRLEETGQEHDRTRVELDRTRVELDRVREIAQVTAGERDVAIDATRNAVDRIHAMESTKFWKLRGAWFSVRRRLGLPGSE